MSINSKTNFFLKNLLRGILWLIVIVAVYLLARKFNIIDEEWMAQNLSPAAVYTLFVGSEVVFGIIPPEWFMFWSIKVGLFDSYFLDVAFLAVLSYIAGVLGYFIGANLLNINKYTFLQNKVGKYRPMLEKYGGFLIIVAAMTPLPFSAIAMLVGSADYKFKNYLLFSLFRFVRFGMYGYVVLQANTIT